MQGINGSQETISSISLWISIFSTVISSISAGIAFVSFKTNSHLQGQMNLINIKLLMDSGLRKYSDELNKIKLELEPRIREISSQASVAYVDILNKIDCESMPITKSDPCPEKYLRHIANDLVTLWYHNFSSILGSQLFVVFSREMLEILHVEPDISVIKNKKNFIKKIVDYCKDITGAPKSARSHQEKFNILLYSYHNRVSDRQHLYDESVKISKDIFDAMRLMKNDFEEAGEKIDRLMDENNIEIVKIEDFPELYQALIKYRNFISVFEDFYLFDFHIQLDAEHLKLNQVLEILFCLFLLQTYGGWGDPRAFPV